MEGKKKEKAGNFLKKHLCPIFTILYESVVEKHHKEEVSKFVNV